jgi:hypothetical protein
MAFITFQNPFFELFGMDERFKNDEFILQKPLSYLTMA